MNKYQQFSKRTIPNNQLTELLVNFSLGLCGESGEVVDLLKKSLFHGHELDKEKLTLELGDVMFYIAGLATICGLDLDDIMDKNIEKLKKRYPNGFSEEYSINRK